jgi:hypothetical protein
MLRMLARFIARPEPELMGTRFIVCTLIKTTLVANLGTTVRENA